MQRNHNEGSKQEPKGNVKETLIRPGANAPQRFDGQHEKNVGNAPKAATKPEDHLRREQPHH